MNDKILAPGNIPVPIPQCPDCVPGTGYICEVHRGDCGWQIGDEIIRSGEVIIRRGGVPIEAAPLLKQDGSPIPVEPDVLIMPHGMAGGNTEQDLMEAGLRAIAVAASEDSKGEWAEKYGTNFENDVFAMHRYCWCEKEDCPWCSGSEPHFLFKPSGFSIDWYKFIGRSMEPSKPVSAFDIVVMILHCLVSIYYMENEKVFRIWRCSKCGAEHKLAVIPLKKLIDATWTHPKCGGHWEIVEQIKMPMDEKVEAENQNAVHS